MGADVTPDQGRGRGKSSDEQPKVTLDTEAEGKH